MRCATSEVEPVVRLMCDARAVIGESPVWQRDRVRWTDPISQRLFTAKDGKLDCLTTAAPVWSLAVLPDGTLAGALDDRFAVIATSGEIVAGPAAMIDPGCRFNDMTADAQGGLWVGAMHRGILAASGSIFYARSPQDRPIRVAEGLGVPNGMKLSADGRCLYVVDTLQRTLLCYPVRSGTLGEPVIVSDFLGLPGKPDGMTLAADGTFWAAMWGGSCVAQLTSDGAFLRQIALPAPHVSSLCFASEQRLLITTSRMRLSPQALLDHPGSGGLFEIQLELV
jgi:sugar lactone lactonase YvrE